MFKIKDGREYDKFNPLNPEMTLDEMVDLVYHHKYGGPRETAGILGIGTAVLLTTPIGSFGLSQIAASVAGTFPLPQTVVYAFAQALTTYGLPLMSFASALSLSSTVLGKWRKRFLLKSVAKVESSIPPLDEDDTGGLFLGYSTDTGKKIGIPDDSLFRHCLIVGQSGMGKTVLASAMMFQQIQRGGGLLFIDGKVDASNIQMIYEMCVWAGRAQDFLVLNPGQPYIYRLKEDGSLVDEKDYDPTKPHLYERVSNTNTYNPILDGDPDEIASRIMSLIPSTESNAGADYYKQSGAEALAILFGALKAIGKPYHFLDVVTLLNSSQSLEGMAKELDKIATVSEDEDIINANKSLKLFIDRYRAGFGPNAGKVDVDKMKNLLGGIAGRLFQFGSGVFGQVLNDLEPDVNLYRAITGSKIVYVALPTMGKDIAANNFGKILLGDFKTAVSWLQKNPSKRPTIPFMLFADEASSYSTDAWSVVYEQARSAGVFLMPAIQTDSGFTNISEDFKERVMGNTFTKIFFRVGTSAVSEMAAELIGKTRKVTKSTSFSVGDSASAEAVKLGPEHNKGANVSGGITEREEEGYLVDMKALESLNIGECVVSYGGNKIFDVAVPLLSLSKEMKQRIGPYRLNFPKKRGVTGINIYENSTRGINTSCNEKAKSELRT